MYKIGFIDDDTTLINDYMTRLKRDRKSVV